ncbi:MAG: hypothetical protein HC854_15000 [Flavobacterium sp.]|nr:hypothetical protein [Flavobacterium sp.]
MSKFDEKIIRLKKAIEIINKKENRKETTTKDYQAKKMRIYRAKKRFEALKEQNKEKSYHEWSDQDKKNFEKNSKKRKEDRIKQLNTQYLDMTKSPIKMTYVRYADDWILMTNHKDIRTLKEKLKKWIKKNLELELSEEKTKLTDLRKSSAKFLGFSLRYNRGRKRKK